MATEMEEGTFFKNADDDFIYGVTVAQSSLQIRLGMESVFYIYSNCYYVKIMFKDLNNRVCFSFVLANFKIPMVIFRLNDLLFFPIFLIITVQFIK